MNVECAIILRFAPHIEKDRFVTTKNTKTAWTGKYRIEPNGEVLLEELLIHKELLSQ